MGVTLVKNKQHMIIKRDGRLEPYDPTKLRKVILWATDNNEAMTDQLLTALSVKLYDKMPIQKLFDEVIRTASNLVSTLYPLWDEVAKKLYILKIYKEIYGLKKTGTYPNYLDVIQKGLEHKVYDKRVFESYSKEELEELGQYIDPDRDFLFNFSGINIFVLKYCLNYTQTKKLELPQHAYMRIALASFYTEKDRDLRMKLVKEKYDLLSTHKHTEATPKMINSGTPKPQLASCVLITMDDDTISITETVKHCSIYSKYAGGLAVDVSRIRSGGSFIEGNRGVSSGPIPFIKMIESAVLAFNQGGTRKGSAVISFPFWHYDVLDIIDMKRQSGPIERRANKLQYAFKWYDEFTKAILNDDYVYVMDPKNASMLYKTYGEDFSLWYERYKTKSNVRKKKVKAIEIAHKLLEVRKETGNMYITFIDNINYQRMGEEPVFSSNLCQEITVPSMPSKYIDTKIEIYFENMYLDTYESKSPERIDFYYPGEIGLCNLSSIDIDWWYDASDIEKKQLAYNLLRSADNAISAQFYPIKEAMYSNVRRRPIGIGTYNLAKLLARLHVKFTDEAAKEIVHKVYEDMTWYFLLASTELAKERGHYQTMKEGSKWQEGKVPIDVSLLRKRYKDKRPDLVQHLNKDWDLIRERIYRYGVRFSYHFAIAPTANSVKAINATESIEPVPKLFTKDKGVFTYPFVPPKLNDGYQYQIAWEIPAKTLIELAAIRQQFLDQSQSINLYYNKPDSLQELLIDVIYAQSLGIKTLYYMKTPKAGEVEVCESCAT